MLKGLVQRDGFRRAGLMMMEAREGRPWRDGGEECDWEDEGAAEKAR